MTLVKGLTTLDQKLLRLTIKWPIVNTAQNELRILYPKGILHFNQLQISSINIIDQYKNILNQSFKTQVYNNGIIIQPRTRKIQQDYFNDYLSVSLYCFYNNPNAINMIKASTPTNKQLLITFGTQPSRDFVTQYQKEKRIVQLNRKTTISSKKPFLIADTTIIKNMNYPKPTDWLYLIRFANQNKFQFTGRYRIINNQSLPVANDKSIPALQDISNFFNVNYNNRIHQINFVAKSTFLQLADQSLSNNLPTQWTVYLEVVPLIAGKLTTVSLEAFNKQDAYTLIQKYPKPSKAQLEHRQPSLQDQFELPDNVYVAPFNTNQKEPAIIFNSKNKLIQLNYLLGSHLLQENVINNLDQFVVTISYSPKFKYQFSHIYYPAISKEIVEIALKKAFSVYQNEGILVFTAQKPMLNMINTYHSQTGEWVLPGIALNYELEHRYRHRPDFFRVTINHQALKEEQIKTLRPIVPSKQALTTPFEMTQQTAQQAGQQKENNKLLVLYRGKNKQGLPFDVVIPKDKKHKNPRFEAKITDTSTKIS